MTSRQKWFTTESPLYSLVYWRRIGLTLASLWLLGIVIAFVVLQVKHQVLTPIGDWFPRILFLLGLR
jgi:hypothetical protein